jgi:hypothetical protein
LIMIREKTFYNGNKNQKRFFCGTVRETCTSRT